MGGENKQNENGSCLFTRSHDSMPIKHRHSVSRLSSLIRHPSADKARGRERERGARREEEQEARRGALLPGHRHAPRPAPLVLMKHQHFFFFFFRIFFNLYITDNIQDDLNHIYHDKQGDFYMQNHHEATFLLYPLLCDDIRDLKLCY